MGALVHFFIKPYAHFTARMSKRCDFRIDSPSFIIYTGSKGLTGNTQPMARQIQELITNIGKVSQHEEVPISGLDPKLALLRVWMISTLHVTSASAITTWRQCMNSSGASCPTWSRVRRP